MWLLAGYEMKASKRERERKEKTSRRMKLMLEEKKKRHDELFGYFFMNVQMKSRF